MGSVFIITTILVSFCTVPEIQFDQKLYNVSGAGGLLQIRIVTNRLNMNGAALFYTEDDTTTG